MTHHPILAALAAGVLLSTAGCAVTRGQETPGAYVDDAAITTRIKARFVESPDVAAASIKVETLNGTVLLSGFARSGMEKDTAERIARETSGVRAVRNEILVRP
jgi:osmotically-inducible protein OsmY